MVVYEIDIKPGIPDLGFGSGFLGEVASIFVGPERCHFHVLVDHVTSIGFFARAFGGRFREAFSKTIDLPDEDLHAFAIFLRWLYRGLSLKPNTFAETTGTITTTTFSGEYLSGAMIVLWVKVLLMADKWCVDDLALQTAKHLLNVAIREMSTPDGEYRHVFDGYRAAGEHRFRFILVHSVQVGSRGAWLDGPFGYLKAFQDDFPNFLAEFCRYTTVFNEAEEAAHEPYRLSIHAALPEEECHASERFLLPLLFERLEFPAKLFASMRSMCPEEADRRKFIRMLLQM